MGLFQSKPAGKKVHTSSPQGVYKASSPNALSRSMHPASVSSHATSGGRRRKQKGTRKKRGKKRSRRRH